MKNRAIDVTFAGYSAESRDRTAEVYVLRLGGMRHQRFVDVEVPKAWGWLSQWRRLSSDERIDRVTRVAVSHLHRHGVPIDPDERVSIRMTMIPGHGSNTAEDGATIWPDRAR